MGRGDKGQNGFMVVTTYGVWNGAPSRIPPHYGSMYRDTPKEMHLAFAREPGEDALHVVPEVTILDNHSIDMPTGTSPVERASTRRASLAFPSRVTQCHHHESLGHKEAPPIQPFQYFRS
jgi:hypothetical protein